MFNFFKRKKAPVDSEQSAKKEVRTAPNTEITYDENLIDKLESDHKKLLAMFTQVVGLSEGKQFSEIPGMLKQFRSAFNAHLLLENVKLYIYLRHCLANEEESLGIMIEMKTEMQTIGKVVSAFLKKYSMPDWTKEMKENFNGELAGIGEVFVERIGNEEEVLYALYMPPENY